MLRRLSVQFIGLLAVMAAVLFGSAGTLDWPAGWVLLGEFTAGGGLLSLWLLRHDPALLRERLASPFQRQQVFSDKLFIVLINIAMYGWIGLMGLDARRWRWSNAPPGLGAAGALLIAISFVVIWLTFRENSFAAPVVKLQPERGQTVIATGPYALVRHPMYAGVILYFVGSPLLLGSWLGLAGVPLLIGVLMIRIAIEERELRHHLAGYADYAARVRWRLLPSVW